MSRRRTPCRSLAAALVSQARRGSGLSQRELGRRAKVSRTTVMEIEDGRRDPSIGTLRAVLRGARVDLDVRLMPYGDHDEVLANTLQCLPAGEKARLEAGLTSSRPLLGPR